MVHSFPTRRSSDLGLDVLRLARGGPPRQGARLDRRSEEHTSELQSHHPISYAVFCLKKKNPNSPTWCTVIMLGWLRAEAARASSFFFNDTATTEIYTGWYTLSLHDALPI